ncbi:malate dehydrogenase [Candidatus Berkiella cookevillensis]|uniref:NADP-dependent malic enzyme n=1 Tax=Candidatus Berkiella cookevillensis TaxID=437022 RepID=A0A0Q9YDX4_9GAMM|nr:malic enzyme-like NAD(P)-binding protein [Candidatus Berkiella cookevillensis]MCS5709593.1 malate dehydrogenase [Candidatus Berkiella cookevillensis]
MTQELKESALAYHSEPRPGKLCIQITKPTETQRDLALAYTPGVAEPVRQIKADPELAYQYTLKGNLVGVITNGTAVLGLGNVGPLAAKPVMEGKAVLFKQFADIDVFDIEVNASNPQAFINTVARIAPTFGGINLEDIKGPQCFEIEQALIERLDIPVFHDDQHGTAIITVAALLNALELQGKNLDEIKVVCLGAGAAGIASMRLLIAMGLRRDQIYMIDREGVIHTGRADLNPYKFAFAAETQKRTLAEAIEGADVFIGVSGANLLSARMLQSMNDKPIVFALSNPDPEISPEIAHSVRDDLIMATGRSDYPNQVNNVLCFPYIFRGALDVRATRINQEMMIAAVMAIRDLAKQPVPEIISKAYDTDKSFSFGSEYILPKPMDPRLKMVVSSAVAQAAITTGVAKLPYPSHYPKLKEDNGLKQETHLATDLA